MEEYMIQATDVTNIVLNPKANTNRPIWFNVVIFDCVVITGCSLVHLEDGTTFVSLPHKKANKSERQYPVVKFLPSKRETYNQFSDDVKVMLKEMEVNGELPENVELPY